MSEAAGPSGALAGAAGVASRLAAVRERVARAAERAGRSPPALVAVSKLQPAEAIRAAYAAGQRDFGENYVQELEAKARELADLEELRWHFIGHLQRNKAKLAASIASVVHTVDSARLAAELGKRAAVTVLPEPRRWPIAGASGRLPVLIEVNVGGEASKSGCAPCDLEGVLSAVDAEPALALAGLMTVPPHTDDPGGARPYFERLLALRDAAGGAARLPELSMGMTHDLEVAVACGATIVRVGTAIFGARAP
ncbi:MAG: YggS family pyridoxal phosphate-dependent enzyme [Polyangiaceae bacterium]|nr:YggS family pyridoxal phosphate-dependent enzyme [Polyangiaceae bacterium]